VSLTIRFPFGGASRSRHYGVPVTTATMSVYIATLWALPDSPNSAASKAAFWLSLAVTGAGTLLSRAHEKALCERCGTLPEDPGKAARRRLALLAWEHLTHGTRMRHAITEAVWWWLFAAVALAPGGWSRPVITAAFAWALLGLWSVRAHNRLAPWCPWCRGDGGDDDTQSAPTPSPSTYQPA
jgi:hypothetical protein